MTLLASLPWNLRLAYQNLASGEEYKGKVLDSEQQRAIQHVAMGRRQGLHSAPIIDGPPGTGKTTVACLGAVAYLMRRERERRKYQVAMLTYSNSAADQTLITLKNMGADPELVVRIAPLGTWHDPASDLKDYFLYYEGDHWEGNEARLKKAGIFVTTADSAHKAFKEASRPYVIFDEISQISVSKYFGTLARASVGGHDINGVALVGDPAQLPVVTYQRELEENIACFLLAQCSGARAHRLTYQYRMHEAICGLVNELRSQFRGHPLETHEQVRGKTLLNDYQFRNPDTDQDSPVWSLIDPNTTCILVDTDSLPGAEQGIWFYHEEAELAVEIARLLARSYPGLEPVLISPYDLQREHLRELCQGQFRCLSIHQAQGREYDCVVLSMTRKNQRPDIGFLAQKPALTYVGCSRAKRKLVVLMSRGTFEGHRNFPQLISYAMGSGRALGSAFLDGSVTLQQEIEQKINY